MCMHVYVGVRCVGAGSALQVVCMWSAIEFVGGCACCGSVLVCFVGVELCIVLLFPLTPIRQVLHWLLSLFC